MSDTALTSESEQILEQALELVRHNRYKPADAYYVTEDKLDTGECENYCGACIDFGVRKAQRYHNTKRKEIITLYKGFLDKGFYMKGRKRIKVSRFTVLRNFLYKIKDYPEGAEFSYSPYDPNFSGCLTQPESCNKCGRYFDTTFGPDDQEAEYLLELIKNPARLTARDKWELAGAFEGFENVREESAKDTLLRVAEKLVGRFSKLKTKSYG